MIKKCIGCGIDLQSDNVNEPGYIRKDKYEVADYCEKCFKMIHYGEVKEANSNIEADRIIKDIVSKNSTIVFMVDVLSISNDSIKYLEYFKNNKKYILLTKYDLLPKSVREKKIIKYFKENFCNDSEVFCISNKNKYNIEKFMEKLKKDKVKEVYIVGNTNSGKSSFINVLLSLNNMVPYVSTSPINNTTVSYLNIKLNDLEIIDTPGFNINSISNFLNSETLLKIMPKKEIKIKTVQIVPGYSVIINNILRIDYNDGNINSFNFYMNNNLKYKTAKIKNNNELKTLPNKTFDICDKDVVINGLGFVKINKPANITVYTLDEELISIRNKMI